MNILQGLLVKISGFETDQEIGEPKGPGPLAFGFVVDDGTLLPKTRCAIDTMYMN